MRNTDDLWFVAFEYDEIHWIFLKYFVYKKKAWRKYKLRKTNSCLSMTPGIVNDLFLFVENAVRLVETMSINFSLYGLKYFSYWIKT